MASNTKLEKNTEQNVDIDENVKSPEPVKKNKKNKAKKGKKKFIVLGIILFLVAGITAIFIFNPLAIRDEYFYPALRAVPIVKNIIPEDESQKDEYSDLTKEELVVMNKKINAEKTALEEEKKALEEKVANSDKELVRLKEIEAAQLQFKTDKEEFDTMIAQNDPDAYKTFYESIAPENAENLYREILGNSIVDKELKKYVQTFENMKKDAAAKVLEEMIGTDMDLVVRILTNISNEQRGAILGAMDSKNAASVVKQMAPPEQQQTN